MQIEKIKNRNIIFRHNMTEWDLNIHLITGNKYNYIIDTGLGSFCIAPVKEFLKNNPNPIIIINTHHHWDHIWGNNSFNDCTIISHKYCRDLIALKWEDMLDKKKQFIKGDVQICLPNMVFEEMLYFPDDKIKIIYTPGHTIDTISVLDEEEKVINVSDNIGDSLDQIIPSIETSKDTYINTLYKYMNFDFDTCVSGHNINTERNIIDKILKEYV